MSKEASVKFDEMKVFLRTDSDLEVFIHALAVYHFISKETQAGNIAYIETPIGNQEIVLRAEK